LVASADQRVASEPSLALTGRLVSLPLAVMLAFGMDSLVCASADDGASARPVKTARPATAAILYRRADTAA
jgi:hypothetical protein